jgi:hypothetical protein
VDESIQKAREKAEGFLFQQIKDISDGLNLKNKLSYPMPPEFEAHTYLAHKNNKLKSKYADELRDILCSWINEANGDEAKIADIFFPNNPMGTSFFETISLLRVIEIFNLPGFNNHIDRALDSIKEFLIEGPKYYGDYWADDWFLFRSLKTQEKLIKHLQAAALIAFDAMKNSKISIGDIMSRRDEKYRVYHLPFWIIGIIFLIMSKLGEKYSNYAKSTMDKIYSFQEENGSIANHKLTTCSFITAAYLTNTDPSNISQMKALRWLLQQQKKSGGWNLYKGDPYEYELLSTVLVLEAIDLITNDEPLPHWIPTDRIVTVARKKQERPVTKFPLPKGVPWSELTIRFMANRVVWFKDPEKSEALPFYSVGLEHSTSERPNVLCLALVSLARFKEISRSTIGLHSKIYKDPKSHIYRLKELFWDIFEKEDESPFLYSKKTRSWTPKFSLELANDEIYDEILDDFKEKFDLPHIKDL